MAQLALPASPTVRTVRPEDAAAWLRMRSALWPDGAHEHEVEIGQYFSGAFPRWPWTTLLAEDEGGRAIGMIEVSIRTYAEGCRSHAVAYLEGLFVVPEARRRGVAAALMAAAERWGRSQGCTEIAADTAPENVVSAATIVAAGFADVGLVRCFRKEL